MKRTIQILTVILLLISSTFNSCKKKTIEPIKFEKQLELSCTDIYTHSVQIRNRSADRNIVSGNVTGDLNNLYEVLHGDTVSVWIHYKNPNYYPNYDISVKLNSKSYPYSLVKQNTINNTKTFWVIIN